MECHTDVEYTERNVCVWLLTPILHLNCLGYVIAENPWSENYSIERQKLSSMAAAYGICDKTRLISRLIPHKYSKIYFLLHCWKKVDIGSGNGSVPPGDKTLLKPMLIKITDTLSIQDIVCFIWQRMNSKCNITAISSITQYVTCFMIPNLIKLRLRHMYFAYIAHTTDDMECQNTTQNGTKISFWHFYEWLHRKLSFSTKMPFMWYFCPNVDV